jgi:hypothetical protein
MEEILLNYYENLLIMQYHALPKATATVRALIRILLTDGMIAQKVRDAFDLYTAVGRQLDILGCAIGVDRNVDFNTGNPDNNFALEDEDYRNLLKIKIILNNTNLTHRLLTDSLFALFGEKIIKYNNYNMSVTYIATEEYKIIFKSLLSKNIAPAPSGVLFGEFYTPIAGKIFGMADANKKLSNIQDFLYGFTDANSPQSGSMIGA